jgi:hypothetical protein
MMHSLRRWVTWLLATGFAGCTFTGLADYDIPDCDPGAALKDDPCNALNQGNTTCQRFQCNAARRCALAVLDEDKDGDPPFSCGGTDCDDHDRTRSGKAAEICDAIDNDCDGLTDNRLLRATTARVRPLGDVREGGADLKLYANGAEGAFAAYLGASPACVHGVTLGSTLDAGTDCIVIAGLDGGPVGVRQPDVRSVGVEGNSAIGIAFVDETPPPGCRLDRLGFLSRRSGVGVAADCGASMPTLASFPLQAESLIAFYDTPVADPKDSGRCAALVPVPLKVRYVDEPTGDAPNLKTSATATIGQALAMRAPALLPVAGGAAVLLASPIDSSAGLWSLTPDGRVIPLATAIPSLDGARAVAMASGGDATTTRISMVAERGCSPNQSITMVTARFDPTLAQLVGDTGKELHDVPIVAGPATVATAPAIAWSAARSEWWVAWIDERGKAVLRRTSADGAKMDELIDLGDASSVAVALDGSAGDASPGEALTAFLAGPDGVSVDAASVTCAR